MAANGLTQQQIADSLGISVSTLYGRKRESEEFEEAIKRGKAKGVALVTNELMKQVKSGNVTAMIFFLKARAGWKEKNEVDLTNSDGSFAQPRKLQDLFDNEIEVKSEAEASD